MTDCQTCGQPITKVDGAWQHWNGGRPADGDHPPVPAPLPPPPPRPWFMVKR